LLNTVLLAVLATSIAISVVALLFHVLRPDAETLFTLLSGLVMTAILGGLLLMARRGRLALASILFLGLSWLVVTIWIFTVSGISSDSSALAYALLILLAGLLLGGRAAMIVTALSVVAVTGAYLAESTGLLVVVEQPTSVADLFFVAVPLILTGVLLVNAMQSISDAIGRARRNEAAQIEANRQLEMLRATLEQRVADRTNELERRSVQLQAATEVSRAATSILDVEELIWQVAELIRERFGLYHVGLLLLDEAGDWAVYRAGSGEAGRELREQGFRLQVGGNSIVGWCTANARARVAQDVAEEVVRVDHELVLKTRSEAALPLIARGQVLGALSVQSDRVGAFDRVTVATLQTIADQVAVALDNARLYSESQQALEATRRAYGLQTREAWLELLRSRTDWGYRYADQAVMPVQGEWRSDLAEVMQTGKIMVQATEPNLDESGSAEPGAALDAEPTRLSSRRADSGEPALVLPLKVREDTIGVLGFYKDSEGEVWTPGEAEFLQRLVDQLGAALESAQLYQETQRRAIREQAIRQVTERMRSAVEIETILQNTVVELAKAMGAPRAYVRLGTEAELLSSRQVESDDGHRSAAEPATEPVAGPVAGPVEESEVQSLDQVEVVPVEGDAESA
jgi:GAF domain-containing protein